MTFSNVEVLRKNLDKVLCQLSVCSHTGPWAATEGEHIVLHLEYLGQSIAARGGLGSVLNALDHLFSRSIGNVEDLSTCGEEYKDINVLSLLCHTSHIDFDWYQFEIIRETVVRVVGNILEAAFVVAMACKTLEREDSLLWVHLGLGD